MFRIIQPNFLALCLLINGVTLILSQNSGSKTGEQSQLSTNLLNLKTSSKDGSAASLKPSSSSKKSNNNGANKSNQLDLEQIALKTLQKQVAGLQELSANNPKLKSKQQNIGVYGQQSEQDGVDTLKVNNSRPIDGQVAEGIRRETSQARKMTLLAPGAIDGKSIKKEARDEPTQVNRNNKLDRQVSSTNNKKPFRPKLLCWLEPANNIGPPGSASRQFGSFAANESPGPVDLLSLFQRGLVDGKNSLEAQIDEHFGVSLPTRLIEKTADRPNKSLINFDEGRKLWGGKRGSSKISKALQEKVNKVSAKLVNVQVVFDIIQSILKLVSVSGDGTGEDKKLTTEILKEVLKVISNLHNQ